jgi:uncharacterized protein with NRDE domain
MHRDFPLILAANRDEAYARPTAPASFWNDYPYIYAGRDLEHRGTWLGITRGGRVAAVTNFRDGLTAKASTRSRGDLVAAYLRGNQRPGAYLTQVNNASVHYNGFNLLAGDLEELHYLSNRGGKLIAIAPGVHGLSNHLLNSPWPKVERGRKILGELLESKTQVLIDGLFKCLTIVRSRRISTCLRQVSVSCVSVRCRRPSSFRRTTARAHRPYYLSTIMVRWYLSSGASASAANQDPR